MPKKTQPRNDADESVEKYYREALSLAGVKLLTDILMARLAFANKDNKIALKCYSEAYGRNSWLMAKATERHPEHFALDFRGEGEIVARAVALMGELVEEMFAESEIMPTADLIVGLFNLAQVGEDKEEQLWHLIENRAPAWKIKEEVDALKRRRPRQSKERMQLRADVKLQCGKHQTESSVIELTTAEPVKQESLPSGEYEVRLYATEQ